MHIFAIKNKRFSALVLLLASTIALPSYALDYQSNTEESIACAGDHAEKLLAALPQDKCTLLKKTMDQAREQNASLRKESQRLMRQLDAMLLAPEFDRKTYLDKSAKLGTLRAKMRATEEDAFTSVAAQFSQSERKILVKWRELRHHRDEWSHREWSPTHDKGSKHQP